MCALASAKWMKRDTLDRRAHSFALSMSGWRCTTLALWLPATHNATINTLAEPYFLCNLLCDVWTVMNAIRAMFRLMFMRLWFFGTIILSGSAPSNSKRQRMRAIYINSVQYGAYGFNFTSNEMLLHILCTCTTHAHFAYGVTGAQTHCT